MEQALTIPGAVFGAGGSESVGNGFPPMPAIAPQESGGQGAWGDASESRSPEHMCPGVFQEPWSSYAPLCHGYRPTPARVRTAAHDVGVHTHVHTHSLW